MVSVQLFPSSMALLCAAPPLKSFQSGGETNRKPALDKMICKNINFQFLCMAISFSRLLVLPTFSLNILDANRLCVFHQVRECPAQLHCFFLSVYPGKIKQINFPLINVISIHIYFYSPSPVPTKKSPLQIPTECSQPPPPLLQVITNSVSTNLPKKAPKYPRELPGLISYF